MRTEQRITTPVFATISLAAGLALTTSQTLAGDYREGFGGDTYEQRSFRTVTGMTVTVKPRQKPPCYGDACWFFGR